MYEYVVGTGLPIGGFMAWVGLNVADFKYVRLNNHLWSLNRRVNHLD